jgi:hypothetical protein
MILLPRSRNGNPPNINPRPKGLATSLMRVGGTGGCLGPNNLGNVNLCLYIYTSNVSLDVKSCAPASDEASVLVQQISLS